MSGLDVLRAVKADESLARIPIIVTTSEKETEIESLKLGAIDFIPKPYPSVGVIQARVLRTIELSEDRELIQSTERDELTGLYNREYFYRYAEQYDQFHKETEMDAIIVDVNHFHMINERYGKAYGDKVLRGIGELVREMVRDSGGIVCRRQADTFMVYCPHRDNYRDIMERVSDFLAGSDVSGNRVRLRMGIYYNVDKTIDIERRFDRAKMAADTVKGSFTNNIGIYDNHLHEQQIYAEQLIEDFQTAIEERQFQVFYQPKFDVRPDTPVLAGAEALVRWFHPELGMISPGFFIPLFEENGLIQRLDNYVWEETARQIREWKDRLNYSVPVSVNVSRIDLFDPGLPDKLQGILRKYDLTGRDFHLEVTESAYTQDAGRIIEAVENLRALGFLIEMDDFGTGYSSFERENELSIESMKIDKIFIDKLEYLHLKETIIPDMISMAQKLGHRVVAEGVESGRQLNHLLDCGCDNIQGYLISKPLDEDEALAFQTHFTYERPIIHGKAEILAG